MSQLDKARFGTAAYVKYLIGYRTDGGEEVGSGDVLGEDEIHGLRAIPEDERRFACRDPLHPSDQHLGVEPMDVHTRSIDVEVTEGHVIQPPHRVKAAQQALVEHLRRPVDGVVSVRMLALSSRKLLRQAVDRC